MSLSLTNRQINKMQIHGIPEHMRGGLQRYFERRIPPGGFLTAVLENDLFGAFSHADPTNRKAIFSYIMWLCNESPNGMVAWGSAKKVQNWISGATADPK